MEITGEERKQYRNLTTEQRESVQDEWDAYKRAIALTKGPDIERSAHWCEVATRRKHHVMARIACARNGTLKKPKKKEADA